MLRWKELSHFEPEVDVLGEDLLRMENLLGVELDVKSGDTIQVVPSGRTHNLIWSLVCLEIHNQFNLVFRFSDFPNFSFLAMWWFWTSTSYRSYFCWLLEPLVKGKLDFLSWIGWFLLSPAGSILVWSICNKNIHKMIFTKKSLYLFILVAGCPLIWNTKKHSKLLMSVRICPYS